MNDAENWPSASNQKELHWEMHQRFLGLSERGFVQEQTGFTLTGSFHPVLNLSPSWYSGSVTTDNF